MKSVFNYILFRVKNVDKYKFYFYFAKLFVY